MKEGRGGWEKHPPRLGQSETSPMTVSRESPHAWGVQGGNPLPLATLHTKRTRDGSDDSGEKFDDRLKSFLFHNLMI